MSNAWHLRHIPYPHMASGAARGIIRMRTPSKYTVSYSTVKESQPPSVFCKVACLHNFQLSYSKCSCSSYSSQASVLAVFAHWENVHKLFVLKSSLQSENVIYRPYAACSCIKLQHKQTYGICMTDNNTYIYIYENCIVQFTSVGLAQARPKSTYLPPWLKLSQCHFQP